MAEPNYTFYDDDGVLFRYAWGEAGGGAWWRENERVWERGVTMMGYASELTEERAQKWFGLTHEQLYAPVSN